MGRDLIAPSDVIVEKMVSVFDRSVAPDALGALIDALKGEPVATTLAGAAVVLDANAVLRIPGHSKSTDIVDYLGTHDGPLILPGQVVQEFWNNHLTAIDTVEKSLLKALEPFEKAVEKIDLLDKSSAVVISDAVQKFKEDNAFLFHPETIRRTVVFLETLLSKASVPFAPRSRLSSFAEPRKRSKTPPGFKDSGDGDFLVWCDLLFGLASLQLQGDKFSNVILVSNDVKIDWCRAGAAHPILRAEAQAMLGLNFEIWTLEKLVKAIS
jgi:hypothetical protein